MINKRTVARFREETRNITRNTTILLWVFGVSAIGLLITSFVVPPTGEIHPSVLRGGAILFAFATLAEVREAVREGMGVKLTHGDTTIEVHDLDGEHNKEIEYENS